jgi:hypothetical protein
VSPVPGGVTHENVGPPASQLSEGYPNDKRRSQSKEPPRTPGRTTLLSIPQTSESVRSHTSSSSGETVEKQLTQGMDMDMDVGTDDEGDRTANNDIPLIADTGSGSKDVDLPSQEQAEAEARGTYLPPLSEGPTAIDLRQSQSHPGIEAPIPIQPKLNPLRLAPYPSGKISRQTWYQATSSYSFRRRPKRDSVSGNGVSSHSKHATIKPVRSYSESALPPASPNREKSLSQIQEEAATESRVDTSPQASPSQSSSVGSNVNPFPFAYLQTQAPYQSQSLSQY